MTLLQGVIPVLMTPFTDKQEVNERVLRHFIRRYLTAGVHGLLCLGTNGEFFSLTQEEKIRIMEIAVAEAKGKQGSNEPHGTGSGSMPVADRPAACGSLG
ncbi:dihydrodipicolinate synthase family protein [Paenibacillus sp. LHD-38]|uniref:dihydrodipicolinate synthase family protein n=1 Tax=Paenibacillus sp. LHD-38 TaxID=3072143 RepID=UPI00280D225A|nr:dihydrodipicolinate synthase family protein [Paenibacillus sp. LHD-38]MDQ8737945.1 dihydrodipicolinate synthase family protein [Paenibacillus sp. LHD-38]